MLLVMQTCKRLWQAAPSTGHLQVGWGYEETPLNIPRMGAALHAIVQCCDEELSLYGNSPMQPLLPLPPVGRRELPRGRFASLRPHLRAAAEHLKLCVKLLAVASPDILTPFSRGDKHVSALLV